MAQVEDAEELVRRGIDLRRKGEDGAALRSFERAHAISPTPRTRAQIALAEQALGRWIDAERDLLAAIARPDPWIEENRVHLDAALATIRSHLGWIELTTDRPGAELFVRGTRTSTLPTAKPIRVESGEVAIEARASGLGSIQRGMTVRPGEVTHEHITFIVARPAPDPAATSDFTIAGWSLVAASGAFVIGAAAAHRVREVSAAQYNEDSRCFFDGLTRDQRCGTIRDRVELTQGFAVAGYVLSALAAGAGITLLLLSPSDSSFACAFGPTGVRCSGSL
jgi:hypothetical protein